MNDLQEQKNTWKVHVNVKIELRDFNPLEKAFLTT